MPALFWHMVVNTIHLVSWLGAMASGDRSATFGGLGLGLVWSQKTEEASAEAGGVSVHGYEVRLCVLGFWCFIPQFKC